MSKLDELKEKRIKLVTQNESIDKKIKALDIQIENEELKENADKFKNIEVVLGDNVNFDELLAALKTKDVKALELLLKSNNLKANNSEEESL